MKSLVLLFCFLSLVFSKEETFKLPPDITSTYLVPIFSEDSEFEDFSKTINFILSLPDTSDLHVYLSDNFVSFPSQWL